MVQNQHLAAISRFVASKLQIANMIAKVREKKNDFIGRYLTDDSKYKNKNSHSFY